MIDVFWHHCQRSLILKPIIKRISCKQMKTHFNLFKSRKQILVQQLKKTPQELNSLWFGNIKCVAFLITTISGCWVSVCFLADAVLYCVQLFSTVFTYIYDNTLNRYFNSREIYEIFFLDYSVSYTVTHLA